VTRCRRSGLGPLTDEDLAVALIDPPTRDRIERRSPDGLAGREVETGMMERATNRVPDDEPLAQRPVIVGALGADGEQPPGRAHQQHVLLADLADEIGTVGNGVGRHAGRQVWSRGVTISHRPSFG